MVIYSSDHGSMLGAHGPVGKWLMYEESIRVPLIIRDPRLPAKLRGRRCDKMALSIDLAPTMLALAGVPGIYVHSLFGSQSWRDGVTQTGRNRTINRQKFERVALEQELADLTSLRGRIFAAYSELLRARAAERAFHPYGRQRVLSLGKSVFALLRISPNEDSRVLCLHNVSSQEQTVEFRPANLGFPSDVWQELLSGETCSRVLGPSFVLPPYAVRWLRLGSLMH